MLAIGRALLSRRRLLLLDEPSMGLAPIIVTAIFSALERIVATMSLTVVLVEQNARAALDIAGRGYVLESGVVVESGPSAQLSEGALRAAYLGPAS